MTKTNMMTNICRTYKMKCHTVAIVGMIHGVCVLHLVLIMFEIADSIVDGVLVNVNDFNVSIFVALTIFCFLRG